jgi:hypothetical protein
VRERESSPAAVDERRLGHWQNVDALLTGSTLMLTSCSLGRRRCVHAPCAPFEFDLLLPTLPPFLHPFHPLPTGPQSHNSQQRARASGLRAFPYSALPCLALPLVTSQAAGTCWPSAPPPVRLARSTHTRSTQASLTRGSTAIHAACSRAVVVQWYSRGNNTLLLSARRALQSAAAPPPPRQNSLTRCRPPRHPPLLIGIDAESFAARASVTHCRNFPSATAPNKF